MPPAALPGKQWYRVEILEKMLICTSQEQGTSEHGCCGMTLAIMVNIEYLEFKVLDVNTEPIVYLLYGFEHAK